MKEVKPPIKPEYLEGVTYTSLEKKPKGFTNFILKTIIGIIVLLMLGLYFIN